MARTFSSVKVICSMTTLTLVFLAACLSAGLSPASGDDSLSVAEDLVNELRKLELAVNAEQNQGGETPNEAAAGAAKPPAGEAPAAPGLAGDPGVDTDGVGDPSQSAPSGGEGDAVDRAEDAIEDAAETVAEDQEENAEEAEERREDEVEGAEEDMEKAIEEAEEELEEGRGNRGGRGSGRGKGRGRDRDNDRNRGPGMFLDDAGQRGQDRREGRGRGRDPSGMSPDERKEHRAERKQGRSLARLVRYLEKRLKVLEEGGPEENRNSAMLEFIRDFLNQAQMKLEEQNAKAASAAKEEDRSPAVEGDDAAGLPPSEEAVTPGADRGLLEILRELRTQ